MEAAAHSAHSGHLAHPPQAARFTAAGTPASSVTQAIRQPPLWHELAVCASLLLAACALWWGQEVLAVAAGGAWLVMISMQCIGRLRETASGAWRVAWILASAPFKAPLGLCWRLVRAWRARHSTARETGAP